MSRNSGPWARRIRRHARDVVLAVIVTLAALAYLMSAFGSTGSTNAATVRDTPTVQN